LAFPVAGVGDDTDVTVDQHGLMVCAGRNGCVKPRAIHRTVSISRGARPTDSSRGTAHLRLQLFDGVVPRHLDADVSNHGRCAVV